MKGEATLWIPRVFPSYALGKHCQTQLVCLANFPELRTDTFIGGSVLPETQCGAAGEQPQIPFFR